MEKLILIPESANIWKNDWLINDFTLDEIKEL